MHKGQQNPGVPNLITAMISLWSHGFFFWKDACIKISDVNTFHSLDQTHIDHCKDKGKELLYLPNFSHIKNLIIFMRDWELLGTIVTIAIK